jgi:hypothetical protein
MKHKQVCVTVDVGGELKFSRFQGGDGGCGFQSLDTGVLLDVRDALAHALLEIENLVTASELVLNKTSIEIKLGDVVVFNHTVPLAGTPSAIATIDVPTNLKVKEILEHALNFVDINLKSDS